MPDTPQPTSIVVQRQCFPNVLQIEHPEINTVPVAIQAAVAPCVVCRATTASLRFSIDEVSEQLVVCDGCGIGSLSPMPGPERIGHFYPAEYYGTPDAKFESLVENVVRLGGRQRVRALLKGLPAGSRVLDIGCGRGAMLRAILDLGHEAHGVEISAEAAAAVDPRAQVHIAPSLADAALDEDSFDAVIMWHVLEHVPSPDETLAEIRRILKPGGRLIIAVPNFASWQARLTGRHWFHLDLPRHLYHFTPATLRQLVDDAGFDCRSMRHLALLQNPFGWLQSVLNATLNTPRNSLYTLLHSHETARAGLRRRDRMVLRAAYWLGLPVAGFVSLIEAAARRGGTIALTATLSRNEAWRMTIPLRHAAGRGDSAADGTESRYDQTTAASNP